MARVSKKEARRLHALRIRLSRARRRKRDTLEALDAEELTLSLRGAVKTAVEGLPATRSMVEEAVLDLTAPTMSTMPDTWGS